MCVSLGTGNSLRGAPTSNQSYRSDSPCPPALAGIWLASPAGDLRLHPWPLGTEFHPGGIHWLLWRERLGGGERRASKGL